MRYWKVLDGRESTNGGSCRWRLRVWAPEIPNPEPCVCGYHLCRDEQVLGWLGPTICEAEIHPDAKVVECGDKIVVSRCRIIRECTGWTERTAREFACDCAARALRREHRAGCRPDRRSYAAVRVARRYARGEATRKELSAAMAAAWDVAGAAARAAARAAAGAAARAAAWDAARAAAWDAARKWQYKRLLRLLEA